MIHVQMVATIASSTTPAEFASLLAARDKNGYTPFLYACKVLPPPPSSSSFSSTPPLSLPLYYRHTHHTYKPILMSCPSHLQRGIESHIAKYHQHDANLFDFEAPSTSSSSSSSSSSASAPPSVRSSSPSTSKNGAEKGKGEEEVKGLSALHFLVSHRHLSHDFIEPLLANSKVCCSPLLSFLSSPFPSIRPSSPRCSLRPHTHLRGTEVKRW